MQSRDFCYWLQGFFEIHSAGRDPGEHPSGLSAQQITMIRKHLGLVFAHEIDPSMGPKEHQDKLNAIHGKPFDPGTVLMRC
jgi:hypothetical protein